MYVCFVDADETAPPPSPVVPDAPDGGTEPGTEPLIPGEPLEQPPVSPEDAALCTADLGEDVVPMTGPENDEVRRGCRWRAGGSSCCRYFVVNKKIFLFV